MLKSISPRIPSLFYILLCLLIVSSCDKKDEKPNDGKAALYSFGPTGSKIGDTIRFIGVNLNQVDAIQFAGKGAVVEKSNFTSQTPVEVRLIVPQTAERGFVVLKLLNGDTLRTKTQLNLNVLATITGMTARARPGENITLTGTYLNWVDRVTFTKELMISEFVSQSATELTITVPDEAQTGTLIIHYTGTDSADIETADTLHVTLPLAASFAPNPVKHAANVKITGTDLDLVKKLYFSGEEEAITTFISQTATELVVKVPAGTVVGKVTLEAASGVTTTSAADLKISLPEVTSTSPDPVAPEATVTVNGSNLDLVSSVIFVGVNDPVTLFTSQSATKLVLKVPKGAVSGKITLNVKNSTLSVKSPSDVSILGSSVAPVIIYDDALTAAWNGWVGGGWGGSVDMQNASPVRGGTKSVKISYTSGGYGVPWQLGGANISLAGYKSLKLSVYGGAGSDGKNINIGFNEQDGKTITVKEGQWTDFSIPLAEISSASVLQYLYLKNYAASGDFTIYVDNIGIY